MTKEDEKLYRFIDELERAEKKTEGGEAILYVAKKIAERTKREMIEKAAEWIKSQIYTENIFEYENGEHPIKYICASCCDSVDECIKKFKQAMEE